MCIRRWPRRSRAAHRRSHRIHLKPVSQKERITECVHVAAVLKNSFPFARGMNFCTRVSKKASFPEPPAQSTRPGAALSIYL